MMMICFCVEDLHESTCETLEKLQHWCIMQNRWVQTTWSMFKAGKLFVPLSLHSMWVMGHMTSYIQSIRYTFRSLISLVLGLSELQPLLQMMFRTSVQQEAAVICLNKQKKKSLALSMSTEKRAPPTGTHCTDPWIDHWYWSVVKHGRLSVDMKVFLR